MTEDAVERVIALARPRHRHEAQCRLDAISGLKKIAGPISNLVPPGKVRKQLLHLATTLTKARVEIEATPEEWHGIVFDKIKPDDLARHLLLVGQASEKLAGRLTVTRSGGPNREDAARQRIAADRAFDLLNDYGGPEPTLSNFGKYFELASLLFEIATGQKEKDLSRFCRAHLALLEKDGFPSAKARRKQKKDAKNEPPPPDHILAAARKKTDKEK